MLISKRATEANFKNKLINVNYTLTISYHKQFVYEEINHLQSLLIMLMYTSYLYII